MASSKEQFKKGKEHLKNLSKEDLILITENMLEFMLITGVYSDWWDSAVCELKSGESTPMSELVDAIYED